MRHLRGAVAGLVAGLSAAVCTWTTARAGDPGDGFRRLHIAQSPVGWPAPPAGAPLVLRYAIADRELSDTGAVNCGGMRAPEGLLARSGIDESSFRRAIAEAFRRWQEAAGIAFEPAESPADADIVIGEQVNPAGRAYTNVTLAKTWEGPSRPIVAASICLNPEQPWKVGFDGNLVAYDLVHTLTHEIGHAIGLDHPSGRGHVMSFRYDESRDGLSEGDVMGAVVLYGARPPPGSGGRGTPCRGATPLSTRKRPHRARHQVVSSCSLGFRSDVPDRTAECLDGTQAVQDGTNPALRCTFMGQASRLPNREAIDPYRAANEERRLIKVQA